MKIFNFLFRAEKENNSYLVFDLDTQKYNEVENEPKELE